MPVPYTFANATTAIPLSQLDSNFDTAITLGNTAIQLGNTVTTLNNMTLANVTISSGTVSITNVAVTTANVSGTANISTLVVVGNTTAGGNVSVGGNVSISVNTSVSGNASVTGNISGAGGSFSSVTSSGNVTLSGGTANGVLYLDGSKVATSGTALTFDGTNLGVNGSVKIPQVYALEGRNAANSGTAAWFGVAGRVDFGVGGDFAVIGGTSGVIFGNSATNTEQMRLNSTGLGIGTSSPGAKLQVNDASTGALIRISSSTNNSARGVEWWNNNTANIYGSITSDYTSGVFTYDAGRSVYAGTHVFRIGTGGEAMRIDSSGNLGIGTSSPGYKLQVTTSATGAIARLNTTGGTRGARIEFGLGENAGGAENYIDFSGTSGTSAGVFKASGVEVMRLDSSGNLLVGTTTSKASLLTVQGQGAFGSTGSGGNGIYLYINDALSDNSYLARNSNGTGTTTWYIGNQAITTSSDVRLKDNIKPTERNALELLEQWQIVDHTWNDPSDQAENNRNSRGVWTGVIAQQVQPITPWLVNKPTKDVNEDGTINPWTMDFGYAVPLLVKAIQEQQAIIETLTARVAALESK